MNIYTLKPVAIAIIAIDFEFQGEVIIIITVTLNLINYNIHLINNHIRGLEYLVNIY